MKVFLRSRGKIIPLVEHRKFQTKRKWQIQTERRRILLEIPARDQFESVLLSTLPQNFPLQFVEGYKQTQDEVLQHWPRNPKLICTSYLHSTHEVGKVWLAECAKNGKTCFVDIQHGGTYGFWRHCFFSKYEPELYDEFWSWGWEEKPQRNVRPMPSPKLARAQKRLSNQKRDLKQILLITNTYPRYADRLASIPFGPQFHDYIQFQFQFVEQLLPWIIPNLEVRGRDPDPDWNLAALYQSRFPQVRFDACKKSFMEAVQMSRLVVIDYIGTPMLELAASDHPYVLFWDPLCNEMSSKAQECIDNLRAVGIYHESPQMAADHVSKVYEDVWSWWQDPNVRKAREEFAKVFAHTTQDWVKPFVERALRLVGNSSSP